MNLRYQKIAIEAKIRKYRHKQAKNSQKRAVFVLISRPLDEVCIKHQPQLI